MKLKKIIKIIFVSLLIIFLTFIAARIFMSSDRSVLDDIYPTEKAKNAYASLGEAAFSTCKLPRDMSEDGYFTAYAPSYSKGENEFQITVRYNEGLYTKYLVGSAPDDYYYELRDADGNTVSRANIVCEKERYFYHHYRLSFEDVTIPSETELYLFLCCDSSSYPAKHTAGILVAHPSIEYKDITLSRAEKESLALND